MNVLAGLIFGAFVVAPAVALARGPLPYAATPLELMALPEYCRVRLAPADQRDP
jgi:hypothetical protein